MMFKARMLVPNGTKRSYKPPTFHFFSPTQPPTFFYLSAVTTERGLGRLKLAQR